MNDTLSLGKIGRTGKTRRENKEGRMGAEGAVSVEMGWPGPGQPLHGTGCRVRGTTTAGSGGAAGRRGRGGAGAAGRACDLYR